MPWSKSARQDQELEPPTVTERWLERLGEQLGDFLAEPSAGHVILIFVSLTVVIALGLAYALIIALSRPAR